MTVLENCQHILKTAFFENVLDQNEGSFLAIAHRRSSPSLGHRNNSGAGARHTVRYFMVGSNCGDNRALDSLTRNPQRSHALIRLT